MGLSDIHRPTAPAPSPSGSPEPSGGSGRSGGGSGGSAGKDPGARGEASFTLVWSYSRGRQGGDNAGGPDVDVWVEDPLGRVVNTSQEGRWRMGPTPEGGQADRDDQGGWGTGEGGGPERIFWPKGKAPRGKYRYGVRWFKGLGSARYTLRVYRDEDLFETKTGAITESDHGRNIELGTIVVE